MSTINQELFFFFRNLIYFVFSFEIIIAIISMKGGDVVANNLRRARDACGMTLDYVSEKTLITKSALSKIENGKQNLR